MLDLRAHPRLNSERVSQVILGTSLVVREQKKGWLHVTTPDAYRGWVSEASCVRYVQDENRYGNSGPLAKVRSNLSTVVFRAPKSGASWVVTIGTTFECMRAGRTALFVRLPDGRSGSLSRSEVEWVPGRATEQPTGSGRDIVRLAHRFLGAPYLWGGTTPLGFDCSGLVQLCYRLQGHPMPRDADQQFAWGRPVSCERTRPADLLFFSGGGPGITHVGIAIDQRRFLHSSGRTRGVTIDRREDPFYRRILVGARRYLPS